MTGDRLRGVYLPLITPFDRSGDVAVDAIERLGHEYLDAGATGIVALGTTGESTALDASEKQAVIDACSRVCRRARRAAHRRRRHQQHPHHDRRGAGRSPARPASPPR